ncbi:MAG TPA: preprotein translocase subunit SecG [Verrucomicrobiae bacterium]|nr:preprotein translocase subunit SecG [Verrucomicrobiae bacterium]
MGILIGFLTVILVLNCLFLILLVLIQLPKKEAGAGIAFGGGATDALFGAGSGTALTKITKYSAGLFMGLALLLSVLNANRVDAGKSVEEKLRQKAAAGATTAPAATNVPTAATSAPGSFQLTTPNPAVTNPAATNPPPAPPK